MTGLGAMENGRDPLLSLAFSFLAGVASASLLWWTYSASKGEQDEWRSSGRGDDEDDEMSWIGSVKSRIGELPSRMEGKMPGRTRWPWDKTKRKLSSWAVDEEEEDRSSIAGTTPPTSPQQPFSEEKKSDLCIGSIFGLDVGGTLAKLVYFEQQQVEQPFTTSHREQQYHQAASATAVLEARRASRSSSVGSLWEVRREEKKRQNGGVMHSTDSEEDLQQLYKMRQESVPDNLDKYAESCNIQKRKVSTHESVRNLVMGSTESLIEEGDDDDDEHDMDDGSQQTASQETGMRRSRSMFDLSKSRDHAEALGRFYNFARRLDAYETGVKDKHLSFFSRELGGEFHFIRFETRRMENAMDLIRVNNLHLNIREMGATGGGAHKYAADWQRVLGIEMVKQAELDSLVAGMQFVLSTVVGECYTFRPKIRRNYKRQDAGSTVKNEVEATTSQHSSTSATSSDDGEQHLDKSHVDEWWWSRKVQRDVVLGTDTYPYLLVTIGTGVSILRVDGPRLHERISGSTIGGGTYWGLIRLLTDVEDFEDVMKLAERGDPSKVDMMVGDIYGQNSDALEKLGLPSNLVASSFGKLVAKQDPASGIKQEDLARALLLMVTNNIGQVAYLNAQLHNTRRIYFVGNFLRNNHISQKRLSYAIDYWSKGEMEALFLEHEGYFGALGAFLLSQNISDGEKGYSQWERSPNSHEASVEPKHKRRMTISIDQLRAPEGTADPSRESSRHRRSQTTSSTFYY